MERDNNVEKRKERHREINRSWMNNWRKSHLEEARSRANRYHKKLSPEKLAQLAKYKREWNHRNPARGREIRRKWRLANPKKAWATSTIHSHKVNGWKVSITHKELVLLAEKANTCYICEVRLDYSRGKGYLGPRSNSPSLDRWNNGNELTKRNVKILCYDCNAVKRTKTMKEFVKYCRMVANKFG